MFTQLQCFAFLGWQCMLQMMLLRTWSVHGIITDRILGPQGCVPVENMQLPAAKLIPAVSEAVKVCEERAGRLTRISWETVFQYATFRTKHFICWWCAWSKSWLKKIKWVLCGCNYLSCRVFRVWVSLFLWECFFGYPFCLFGAEIKS